MGVEALTARNHPCITPLMNATNEPLSTQEFRIPDANLQPLKERLEKLSKKAMKLVGEPITLTVVNTVDVERMAKTMYGEIRRDIAGNPIGTGVFDRFHIVTFTGPQPKLAGWTFAAALDVVDVDGEKAVIVRNAPGEAVPAHFRQHTAGCDHCKTDRKRKTLFVLRRENEAV